MIVDGTTHQTAAVPTQQNSANGPSGPRPAANEIRQDTQLTSPTTLRSTADPHDSFEHVSEGAGAVAPYSDGTSGGTRRGVVGGAFEAARELLDTLKSTELTDVETVSNNVDSPLLPKPDGRGVLAQDILKAYGVAGAQADKSRQGESPSDLLDTLG